MPFSDVPERVAEIRDKIALAVARGGHAQTVCLIAVTKTHGPEAVEAAWRAGIRDVGENKVQEALDKQAAIAHAAITSDAADVRWHLIGHLQRNKAKQLGKFSLLHALDSARLADAVHGVGSALGRPIDALLQVNIAGEETKGGFAPSDVPAEADRLKTLGGVRVRGVMTMAPYDADEATLRRVFSGARAMREVLQMAGHDATELSMGMSGDFEIAIQEGATMVRLGTVLFGARA
jgi:pyridoxal phosphate enzyme (YggS family)